MKHAMGDAGLHQLGNRPRFFDASNPINVPELDMQIWQGFKVTAYKYASGCNTVIDSCARFMSTKSVMNRIYEIQGEMDASRYGPPTTAEFEDEVRRQLVNQSVIANYGNKRTYIVQDIKFNVGPCNDFFDLRDGQKISVAKYFYRTYNLKITDKKQPLLIVRSQGQSCTIPSEFCMVDGVPDSIRSNPNAMRLLLGRVKQTPQEKMESIQRMIKQLVTTKSIKEHGIVLDQTPQTLESRRLAVPELIHKEGDDQKLYACERLLKQMPVYSCDPFQDFEILLLHDRYSRNEAESAKESFEKCQRSIKMDSGNIQVIELEDFKGNLSKMDDSLSV
jgi:hypothetical protein